MTSHAKLVTLLASVVGAVALGAQAAAAATPAPRVGYTVVDPRLFGAFTPEPRIWPTIAHPRIYPRIFIRASARLR